MRSIRTLLAIVASIGFLVSLRAQIYSVSTFAGSSGLRGTQDGAGSAARFDAPALLASDSSGNLLVVDVGARSLRRITPAGVVSTVATIPAAITGLAVGGDGSVYLAEGASHVIRRLASDGTLSVFAGQPGSPGFADGRGDVARFNGPAGLAFDSAGRLWVADQGNHTIRRIGTSGDVSTAAGLPGISGYADGTASLARFYLPVSVAARSDGTVVVADAGNYLLRSLAPDGTVSTLAGVAGYSYNVVDGLGIGARFGSMGHIAIASTGDIFVAEPSSRVVRRVDSTATVTTIAGMSYVSGATDGIGSAARFSNLTGIAVDPSGTVFLADQGNFTVRRLDRVIAPTIATAPVHRTVAGGASANFTVGAATGSVSLVYRWQRASAGSGQFEDLADGGAYAGTATATLSIAAAGPAMSGDQFRCILTNAAGSVTSTAASLFVLSAPSLAASRAVTVYVGTPVTLPIGGSGYPHPSYAVTAGVLPAWLSLDPATGVLSGTPAGQTPASATFSVTASNVHGTSVQAVQLVIEGPLLAPAAVIGGNRRVVVTPGGAINLAGSASGAAPLAYQWKRNGQTLAGATTAAYAVAAATGDDAGYYQLVVTNQAGATTSQAVFVQLAYGATEVISWGSGSVPTGLNAVAVAAGYNFGMALRADGGVSTWGDSNVATLPAGVSEVVAIAAGDYHCLALRSDGTVVAWGSNSSGQTAVPAGLAGVVAVAAGYRHSVALRGDGTLVEWGAVAGTGSYSSPAPATAGRAIAVVAAGTNSLVLLNDGSVLAWGEDIYYLRSVPAAAFPAVGLAITGNVGLAVKSDGTAVGWGSSYSVSTTIPAAVSGVRKLAANSVQAIALRRDGTAVTWSSSSAPDTPTPVAAARSLVDVAMSSNFRLALRNASADSLPALVSSPESRSANLGQRLTLAAVFSAGTASLSYQWYRGGTAITGATGSTFRIDGLSAAEVGTYTVTASNALGAASSAPAVVSLNPSPLLGVGAGGRYLLSPGQNLTLGLDASVPGNATVRWERNGRAVPGATARTLAITSASVADGGWYRVVFDAGAGPRSTAALFVLFAPSSTQAIRISSNGVPNTAPADFGPRVVALSQRSGITLALRDDGGVSRYPLETYYGASTAVAALRHIVGIEVGYSASYALRSDGTVATWTDQYYATLPGVDALTEVVAISAGTGHLLALRADGTVVALGSAQYGATAVPADLRDVVAVGAGDGYSLALRADGTVVGWGNNSNGVSTPPVGLSNVTAIAAASSSAYALRSDGTVVGWGSPRYSQPLVPPGLTDVVALKSGNYGFIAVRANGTAVAWSLDNYAGSPPMPPVATPVFAAAMGSQEFWVLRDSSGDRAPTITTPPTALDAVTGQNVVFRVAASSGTAPLTYQWRRSGVAIPGATEAVLQFSRLAVGDTGTIDVTVANYLGAITTVGVPLTVDTRNAVSVAPFGRQVLASGSTLSLTGSTALTGPVTYQWRRNGRPIGGATQAALSIGAVTSAHSGRYELVAANAVGPAVSFPVWVFVGNSLGLSVWGGSLGAVPSNLGALAAVAAGSNHALALRLDGTVVAWGNNTNFQTAIPAGLSGVVAIAAGESFSLALRADGTVACWGKINYVPPGTDNVIAIAADADSSWATALRADGSVVQWGTNGQRSDLPAVARNLVSIDTGYSSRTVAVRSDGRVVQWRGSENSYETPPTVLPEGVGPLVSAVVAGNQNVGLREDGSVVAWTPSADVSVAPTSFPELRGAESLVGASGIIAGLGASGLVLTRPVSGYDQYQVLPGLIARSPLYQFDLGIYHGIALREKANDRAPVIVDISSSQTVMAGQSLTLSVNVTGIPAPAFQWYRNGLPLSGAVLASLTLAPIQTAQAGTYAVIVTNELGSVTSPDIVVNVSPSANSRGVLAATARTEMGATLLGTFTIEGTASKQMLIRAVGPGLAAFGAKGVMSDPRISVYSAAGSLIANNDNWGENLDQTALRSAAATVGAVALPEGGRDAALQRSFAPGTYHVRVAVASGSDGLALLEIFDADANPRLVYLGTLGRAGPGADVLIQGLSLGSPVNGRRYLVRALGPTLGTADALADPQVAIFNAVNSLVASNDDWAGSADLATMAERVGAMPLAADSRDAALAFVPAVAGTYTVQVSAPAGASPGLAFLEVVEVDPSRADTLPPAIVVPPRPVQALAGQAAAFSAVAVGRPVPTFQWRRNGTAISGATRSVYTIAAAQSGDVGDYSVAVTNASWSVVSAAAALTLVELAPAHRLVGPGYHAGATVSIACTLAYAGTASSLGWQVSLPAGWSYAGGTGAEGDVKPAVGATGTLSWAWTTPPPSPVTFSIQLAVPTAETAPRTLVSTAELRGGGGPTTAAAGPGPLVIAAAPTVHTADTNADSRLSLAELTRVIELYNVRFGTVRSGAYTTAAAATEDGFTLDSARGDIAAALSRYHHADTDRDGRLNLSELLRVIQLYNHRSAAVRTGQYHVAPGTEDGFDPGP